MKKKERAYLQLGAFDGQLLERNVRDFHARQIDVFQEGAALSWRNKSMKTVKINKLHKLNDLKDS